MGNDTFGTGTDVFARESEKTCQRFESEPLKFDNFTFAGIHVEQLEDGFLMHQEQFCMKI